MLCHNLRQRGSGSARKWGENEEFERKRLSLFSHSLSIFSFSPHFINQICHLLSKNVKIQLRGSQSCAWQGKERLSVTKRENVGFFDFCCVLI